MKVALIQTRTPATPEAALAHVLPMIREPAAAGATFIATPEGTNVLFADGHVETIPSTIDPNKLDLMLNCVR